MFGLGQGLLEPRGGFKLCSAAAYDLEILTRRFSAAGMTGMHSKMTFQK